MNTTITPTETTMTMYTLYVRVAGERNDYISHHATEREAMERYREFDNVRSATLYINTETRRELR